MKYFAGIYVIINNIVSGLTSRIPDKARLFMLRLSVFVLLWIGLLKYSNKTMRSFTHYTEWLYPVGLLALIVIAAAGIEKKTDIRKIRIGSTFWFGWMLCFAMMFIMSFIKPVKNAYFMWSVPCLFIFPLIFIAWHEKDKFRKLCRIVSECVLVFSYVFILMSLLLVPFFSRGELGMLTDAYIGMAVNPNNNGMLVISFYGPVFYLLLTDRSRNPICCLIPLGFCIAIAVVSDCRTAELGIMLQTGAGLLYYYLSCIRNGLCKVNIIRTAFSALMIILIALAAGMVMDRLDKVDLELQAFAASESSAISSEDAFNKLDSLSSGRLTKTRYFFEHSTFWGHGSPDGPVIEGQLDSKWAFNNAVDILYISGVLPFIGCVLWFLAVIIFCIKCVFGKIPRRPEYLFTIVTFAGYFVEFMLEVTIYPITTSLVLLAYLGMIPVACREKEKRKSIR